MTLSERQTRILTTIEEFAKERGYSPTLREIAARTGISSTSVVNHNLERLEKEGYLAREENTPRSLRLLPAARREIAEAGRVIRMRLPMPPSVNHMYSRGESGKVYKSAEVKAFDQEVKLLGRFEVPFDAPVAVQVVLYRPQGRGDVDNYAKALLDALQGIAYHNDAQVVDLHMVLKVNPLDPHCMVTVREDRDATPV